MRKSIGSCTECGKENTPLMAMNDVDFLCEECVDELYFFCEECQEYYHCDYWESYATKDGRVICENCREDFDDDEIEDDE